MSKWEVFKKSGLSKLSKQKSTLPERDKEGKTVLSKYFPPISQSANMTFFLTKPSLKMKSNETLIIPNDLLLRNVSGQRNLSCTFNNEINKLNVLMAYRKNTDSMSSVEWELARSCKYESIYDKFQTQDHNVVNLGLTIKEKRVTAKYTKDGGMFTVADTSALAVAITPLIDLADFSHQTITKFICANHKLGAPMLPSIQDNTTALRLLKPNIVAATYIDEVEKGIHPHYVQFKNRSIAAFTKEYTALEIMGDYNQV